MSEREKELSEKPRQVLVIKYSLQVEECKLQEWKQEDLERLEMGIDNIRER